MTARIHNLGGKTLDLSAGVTTVKFHGEFVTAVTPDTLLPASLKVTADGITKSYDVNIRWSHETQDFGIAEIIPME